jgi:hypothetical protein
MFSHFLEEQAEARQVQWCVQGHLASKWRRGFLTAFLRVGGMCLWWRTGTLLLLLWVQDFHGLDMVLVSLIPATQEVETGVPKFKTLAEKNNKTTKN